MNTRTPVIVTLFVFAAACGGQDARRVSNGLSAVPAFFYVDTDGNPLDGPPAPSLPVEKLVGGERIAVTAPDGHALAWSEWGAARGSAVVTCQDGGTRVQLDADGLVPGGLYTGWINSFVAPGFAEGGLAAFGGLSPLGAPDGSDSIVVADDDGHAVLDTVTPAGALAFEVRDDAEDLPECLLDGWEIAFDLTLHIDGKTYGPFPGDDDVNADHIIWALREGAPEPL